MSRGCHSSGLYVAAYLKQPTREQRGPRIMSPYLVLLRVGFTLPCLLPNTRCALTAPFHPYLQAGGIFSVALAVGSHPPGVTWHSVLWSPDFPPCIYTKNVNTARLPGQLPVVNITGYAHPRHYLNDEIDSQKHDLMNAEGEGAEKHCVFGYPTRHLPLAVVHFLDQFCSHYVSHQ